MRTGRYRPGQRGRGLDRLRHRHVAPAGLAERDRLAAVEVDRHHEQLAREVLEAVAAEPGTEDALEELLDARGVHEARRQELEGAPGEVGEVAAVAGQGGHQGPRETRRAPGASASRTRRVQVVDRGGARCRTGVRVRVVASSYISRGETPAAMSEATKAPPEIADVEVEVQDAAAEELVEGPQAADLVDGAGDAAAGADEGDLRPACGCGFGRAGRHGVGLRGESSEREPGRARAPSGRPAVRAPPGRAGRRARGSRRSCARAPPRGG